MRLVAAYPSRAALALDVVQQLGRGGLLVRGDVPAGLEMYGAVEVEVTCADGGAAVVPAQVIQMFPGVGVAVSIDAAGCARIEELAAGPPAAAEPEPEPPAETARPATRTATLPGAASLEKIQQALKGDRDARMAVLRSPNRALHIYVLRNPGLTLDEVSAIARMTTVSVDLLRQIAERREWGHRPEIAIALVRNPTVPPPVAIALLDHVSAVELRQLAKDSRTREAIQKAARRKVLT